MNQTTLTNPEGDCPWESGVLGNTEEHARVAPQGHGASLDEALALQMISIRLPRDLIEDLKFIAEREGMGYQPLIRRVLLRFAGYEFKNIARENFVAPRPGGVQTEGDTAEDPAPPRAACG